MSFIDTINILNFRSEVYNVQPFDSFLCKAGSNWEVRLKNGLTSRLLTLCIQKGKVETGGVLIGLANYKTKTIHVFDIIEESQDSKGNCTGFLRGIKGLPDQIESIKEKTGSVIGYIGEWHTHPMNMERLSARDKETIKELIIINRRYPIPTCAIIVTNNKILSFVFE